MKKALLTFSIFTIGFLLNLFWENVQAPLYHGYTNFWDHFMMCFWASIVDAAAILLMYSFFALWFKDFYWITYLNWKSALVLMVLGAAIAVGFEHWAFNYEMWSYTERMPVAPYLQIGWSPLLQMIILPLLTLLIFKRLSNL